MKARVKSYQNEYIVGALDTRMLMYADILKKNYILFAPLSAYICKISYCQLIIIYIFLQHFLCLFLVYKNMDSKANEIKSTDCDQSTSVGIVEITTISKLCQ